MSYIAEPMLQIEIYQASNVELVQRLAVIDISGEEACKIHKELVRRSTVYA